MKVAVIGGGAAGFFAALSCREHHPDAQITIYEKTDKPLAKVKVSGGGRCNVTHDCDYVSQLIKHYPRGGKWLKKAFSQFDMKDTISWYADRGVQLKVESDGRMFPTTDDSMTIVNCLMQSIEKAKITLLTKAAITEIKKEGETFSLAIKNGSTETVDRVIIATGGSPKLKGFDWLAEMGHKIVPPVPSLFTFNMPDEPIKSLMGVVAPNAQVSIPGIKYRSTGPLLITHWGMSGPAILKMSAWAARDLADQEYTYDANVLWQQSLTESDLRADLNGSGRTMIKNHNPTELPSRLWNYLLDRVGANPELPWTDLPKKVKNKLVQSLLHDTYKVRGKTTFKEEFVTCGGVSREDIDASTMQSRVVPGLYFAGEVMDVDAVTGGFNFQAAWSTGYVAGRLSV